MNLKIKDIISFLNSYKEIQNEKMPLSLAYQLSSISKELTEDLSFYQEKYNLYLEKYAEKDEEGNFKQNELKTGVILKSETLNEAHQLFNELDNYEFKYSKDLIPLSDFKKLELSPSELEGLLPFIKE